MPRKSVKSEPSTASPDPSTTPAKAASTKSTPAKTAAKKDTAAKGASKKETPAKASGSASAKSTPKSTPASKTTKKDASASASASASATPASAGAKQRRQSKPRVSSAGDRPVQRSPARAPLAGLPAPARFAAVELVALALLTAGTYAIAQLSSNEMAVLRARPESPTELALLAGWRAAEIAIAWLANLDFIDVGLISFVAHAPAVWLITMFYGIRPSTAVASVLLDVAAPAAAFYLARPLGSLRFAGPKLYNKDLVSTPFQLLIGALSTSVYASVVSLALRFVLPKVFVLYFQGIPTVEPAYSASFLALLPVAAFFGFAASKFIFAAYITTGKSKEDDKIRQFDPVHASLRETVWWNFWGYTLRSRIIITRTAIVTLMTAVSTYLASAVGIDGVSCLGASVYAFVWAFATGATGLALGLVGQE